MTWKFAAPLVLGTFAATITMAQDMAPFGTDKDVAYADRVWEAMMDQNLAGDGAIRSFPYDGLEPTG